MSARLRGLILPAVLVCLALAVLVSLGNWQVRRLAWKEDLIARVTERPASEPIDFRNRRLTDLGDPRAFLDANEYRPILMTGEFRPKGEVLVFTSLTRPRGPAGGPGYWVLTPFVASPDGVTVLVNRGFVPDGREDAYAPPPAGTLTLQGLLRAPETGSWFTPDPKLEERIFFARDPSRIAGATGLTGAVDAFFVDLDASGTPPSGLPQAGETRFSFPNSHLQYAITWYGLAVALLAVFAVFAWRRLKEPQSERLTPPGRRT
jgi:surfeit locus 1 family protein